MNHLRLVLLASTAMATLLSSSLSVYADPAAVFAQQDLQKEPARDPKEEQGQSKQRPRPVPPVVVPPVAPPPEASSPKAAPPKELPKEVPSPSSTPAQPSGAAPQAPLEGPKALPKQAPIPPTPAPVAPPVVAPKAAPSEIPKAAPKEVPTPSTTAPATPPVVAPKPAPAEVPKSSPKEEPTPSTPTPVAPPVVGPKAAPLPKEPAAPSKALPNEVPRTLPPAATSPTPPSQQVPQKQNEPKRAAPPVAQQPDPKPPVAAPGQSTPLSTTPAPTVPPAAIPQPAPQANPNAQPALSPEKPIVRDGTPSNSGAAVAPPAQTPGSKLPGPLAPNPDVAVPRPIEPSGAAAPNAQSTFTSSGPPPGLPPGTPASPSTPPTTTTPLPPPPKSADMPIAPGTPAAGGGRMEDFRNQRQQSEEGGRTVIREPDRVIILDRNGQSFIRHNDADRFRYGARDVRVEQVGNESRTIIIRPDGTQIITVNDRDGRLLRRIRRDDQGRELIIIDNSFKDSSTAGDFYVDLPPPVLRIPQNRYIVESETADPTLIYDTLIAPPVDRVARRYSLDEIRYSPSVRQRMPSIDLNTINFETGSWEIPQEQALKLQVIADGLNRAISRNPREVFLVEGHTDAVGSDVDNLSLSDRRAESAATLLSQQFQVPAENLTSQGYGKQYLKIPTDGPERQNRRVTIRRITPLLTGQN